MAENNRQVRTSDPFDRFDEAINDPGLYPTYQYERPQSLQLQPMQQDRMPLFLSDEQPYERDEQERFEDEPTEYTFGSRRNKPRTSRIVTGVVAATAVAAVVGFFAVDATRSVFVNAKASLASVAPSFGGAPPDAAPPPRVATETAAPQPRIAAPEAQAVYRGKPAEAAAAPAAAVAAVKPAEVASASSPSRDEISAAYQTAVKGGQQMAAVAPTAPAPPQPAAPAVRRMDADELAGLIKRAKGLLAIGDIVSARLLLERAADAQEAEAALILGTTYDPMVVGNRDMRSITPDPAMARQWYQKAATLGSADAKRRLSQLQN